MYVYNVPVYVILSHDNILMGWIRLNQMTRGEGEEQLQQKPKNVEKIFDLPRYHNE